MNDLIVQPDFSVSAEIRSYIEHSLSENTRRAYRSDIDHFLSWGGTIPADALSVAGYLTAFAQILSIMTLTRRLVSIGKAHTVQGIADPTKTELVKLTMKGIRRLHGKPQTQATPILKDDLVVMLSHIPDTIKGKRDKALLLVGFCGAFRRSELVNVRVEDIAYTTEGIVLTIPRSKTDQSGQGRKIGIPRSRGRFCPLVALNCWLEAAKIEGGLVFRSVTKGGIVSDAGLSDRSVSEIVKLYATKAGLNPDKYSAHSLRSGLCTSAAQHGISSWKIRAQSGHASEAMLARYVRDGDLFRDNAAALF